MPWHTKQPTNRGLGVAAVCARAVEAGIIASRSGKASVAPAPRRMVRRDMCFLVINVMAVFLLCQRAARGWLSSTFMFIWNAGLFTILITREENLYWLADESRTIDRTAGMS